MMQSCSLAKNLCHRAEIKNNFWGFCCLPEELHLERTSRLLRRMTLMTWGVGRVTWPQTALEKNREIPNKSFAGALLFASNSMQTWMKKCSSVLHNSRKIHWFPIRAVSLKKPLQSHSTLECHWKLLMWHKKTCPQHFSISGGYIDRLMNHM